MTRYHFALFKGHRLTPVLTEGGQDRAIQLNLLCLWSFYFEGDSSVVVDFR